MKSISLKEQKTLVLHVSKCSLKIATVINEILQSYCPCNILIISCFLHIYLEPMHIMICKQTNEHPLNRKMFVLNYKKIE